MKMSLSYDLFRPYSLSTTYPLAGDGACSGNGPESVELPLAMPSPSLSRSGKLAGVAIVLLLVFVFIGPLVWQQDPSRQWLSQISMGPSASNSARLVDNDSLWQPRGEVQTAVVHSANTEFVRLQWPAVEGVHAYQVFRNFAEQSGLGIPLAVSRVAYYQDELQLAETRYRYTVKAEGSDKVLAEWEVTPEPAMSRFEAQLQGLPEQSGRVILPAHPLGTDALGRDILARLMAGGRTSLMVGLIAPCLFIAFGCLYGALAGIAGGWLDNVAMRVVDFVIALPFLLFMILLRVAFGIGPGEDGVFPLILAMVMMSWTGSARLIRGQVLSLSQQPYVEAARLAGMGRLQIIVRHMLPNVLPMILVSFSFAVPSAIFTEAFLSFIGLGVAPPSTSWGAQCNDGIKTLLSHPQQMLLPAAMISIAVLAFNTLGDALRDAGDSRLRELS
ncbi:ABC transporter permease [Spongiibacter sp. KMU-158]|uniref:ABC transporter permease n=1 Tax=Spongiibacter pelagi TaxID=2760804 RepID=A0A927C0J2_9GAMM|nr:ABC transporter permease [Spongiibacter pelagi]MBD2858489.1 ABC transporter permease [Spongiibacter pelagi]